MKLSIRTQIVLLVGAVLLGAMGAYLVLATRVVTADKEATVYDVNALVAATVAEQVDTSVVGIAGRLRYFGQEYEITPGDAERRARSLFLADDEVLSIEVWKRTDSGFERSFLFVDGKRLGALNINTDDLQLARKQTPVPLDAVAQAGIVLQNSSLAPDLALMRVSAATASGNEVVTADLRPEWLLRTVSASRQYRVFLVDSIGRVLAHPDATRVINHSDLSGLEVVKASLGDKVSRGAMEYQGDDGKRLLAAYARLSNAQGAVVVEAPRDEVFRATRELSVRSLLFAAGVVLLALTLAIFLSRRVTAPLRDLMKTMAVISRGEFGVEVLVKGPAEIASVGIALNEMSQELVRRSDELQRTNAQLVQSEKLSAIGELAASVAHEVKNPMVGIVGFSQLGLESTSVEEMKEYFTLIEQDTLRANKILQNLLEFARPPDVEMEPIEINDVVNGALQLCRHRLMMSGVRVEAVLGERLPGISGSGNQLRQVLLNLMINAGQAMEQSATKRVGVATTASPEGGVLLTVSDTGPGMTQEVRDSLFKPFFTTKRRGVGTGLGLSVSRSIIEAHHGSIKVESEPGKGATFIIHLPERKDPVVQAAS